MNAVTPSPRPRAWRYMLEALLPKAAPAPRMPDDLHVEWTQYRPRRREVDDFACLCGLAPAAGALPPLLLHAIAFRAQMALLTRRAFPLPIWRVLQVRNRLVDLEPVMPDATLAFRCRVHAQRVVAKGLEVDLETCIDSGPLQVASSVNTFYVRSRVADGVVAARVPEPPTFTEERRHDWHVSRGGGYAFARLTGDYNGIHLFDGYARRFGFPRAFLHPLRVVGQAIARAPGEPTGGPGTTEVWMKGPVLRDSDVYLRVGPDAAGNPVLAVHGQSDPRPAIVIRRGS